MSIEPQSHNVQPAPLRDGLEWTILPQPHTLLPKKAFRSPIDVKCRGTEMCQLSILLTQCQRISLHVFVLVSTPHLE